MRYAARTRIPPLGVVRASSHPIAHHAVPSPLALCAAALVRLGVRRRRAEEEEAQARREAGRQQEEVMERVGRVFEVGEVGPHGRDVHTPAARAILRTTASTLTLVLACLKQKKI